mgnify:CR=1 FL=1
MEKEKFRACGKIHRIGWICLHTIMRKRGNYEGTQAADRRNGGCGHAGADMRRLRCGKGAGDDHNLELL